MPLNIKSDTNFNTRKSMNKLLIFSSLSLITLQASIAAMSCDVYNIDRRATGVQEYSVRLIENNKVIWKSPVAWNDRDTSEYLRYMDIFEDVCESVKVTVQKVRAAEKEKKN